MKEDAVIETVTTVFSPELRQVMDHQESDAAAIRRAVAEVFAIQIEFMQACLTGLGKGIEGATPETLTQAFEGARRLILIIETGLTIGTIEFRFEFFGLIDSVTPLLAIRGKLNWHDKSQPAHIALAA